MCLWNTFIQNPRYKANKKNGGIIPPLYDKRALYVPIGCGNCIECRKAEARKWQVRLQEDIKHNKGSVFVTLTFNTNSLANIQDKFKNLSGYKLDNATAIYAVRHFYERWRKEYKKPVRRWLITELGHTGTEHLHIHGLLWMPNPEDILAIESIWKYGWAWIGKTAEGKIVNYVNNQTINYITKYVYKTDFQHKYYKSIVLTSNGIGAGYDNAKMNKFNKDKTLDYYRTESGHKISLPQYYRNKIYNDDEREMLWMSKLDKQTRYVLGQKLDVSQTFETYLQLREQARQTNYMLGYGDNEKDYDAEEYENQIRAIKQESRRQSASPARQ